MHLTSAAHLASSHGKDGTSRGGERRTVGDRERLIGIGAGQSELISLQVEHKSQPRPDTVPVDWVVVAVAVARTHAINVLHT